jgi:antitoxin component YwqK of YwqJK toxin-antitoxin module
MVKTVKSQILLSYNDNGLLLSEGIVDEAGNHNGKWKDLYANGKVQAEGQYTDSRRTGQWKFYNTEGKVEQTGSLQQWPARRIMELVL